LEKFRFLFALLYILSEVKIYKNQAGVNMRLRRYTVVCFLFPVVGIFIFMAKIGGSKNDAYNVLQWTLAGALFNALVVFSFFMRVGAV